MSALLKKELANIGEDIFVQGSRAGGTAKATSDIDIGVRVSQQQFDDLIKKCFGSPNPGSAKERTMLHAIETGKIQAGEAKLRGLRKELEELLGIESDISIILEGGKFDKPSYLPFK
jgi:predicted nucleotidyltransferase